MIVIKLFLKMLLQKTKSFAYAYLTKKEKAEMATVLKN